MSLSETYVITGDFPLYIYIYIYIVTWRFVCHSFADKFREWGGRSYVLQLVRTSQFACGRWLLCAVLIDFYHLLRKFIYLAIIRSKIGGYIAYCIELSHSVARWKEDRREDFRRSPGIFPVLIQAGVSLIYFFYLRLLFASFFADPVLQGKFKDKP